MISTNNGGGGNYRGNGTIKTITPNQIKNKEICETKEASLSRRKNTPHGTMNAEQKLLLSQATACKELGNTLFQEKKYKDAATQFIKAAKLSCCIFEDEKSENQEVKNLRVACYSNCAQCLLALKEYNSAVSMCNEALRINDVHGKTLCRRGIAYMRQGLLKLARKDFEKAILLDSNNANVKKQIIKLEKLEKKKVVEVIDATSMATSSLSIPLDGKRRLELSKQEVVDQETAHVELVKADAERGDAEAQYNLGFMYQTGQGGVEPDIKRAVEYYSLAVEQGHAGAQCNLGTMYWEGRGVETDVKRALELYALAAEQGHPAAQYNLGNAYSEGRGVEPDKTLAQDWMEKAAAQGFEKAKKYSNK